MCAVGWHCQIRVLSQGFGSGSTVPAVSFAFLSFEVAGGRTEELPLHLASNEGASLLVTEVGRAVQSLRVDSRGVLPRDDVLRCI